MGIHKGYLPLVDFQHIGYKTSTAIPKVDVRYSSKERERFFYIFEVCYQNGAISSQKFSSTDIINACKALLTHLEHRSDLHRIDSIKFRHDLQHIANL
jgi:hypothetical protein